MPPGIPSSESHFAFPFICRERSGAGFHANSVVAILVPRLADDTSVVTAGGEDKCEFAIVKCARLNTERHFADLIAFRFPHDEHREFHVVVPTRPAT